MGDTQLIYLWAKLGRWYSTGQQTDEASLPTIQG